MDKRIKVVQVGLGPLGQKMLQFAGERSWLEITAGVDPAPDKAGRSLSRICGLTRNPDITVSPDFASALKAGKPDVALLTTVSSLERIAPQIAEIAAHGVNIVSTCEELSFPWRTRPELARKIDETARKGGVVVLGTGVNPGFLMDFLPVALTAACQKVERIKVSRIQDASFRRIPFRKKIGAGLSPAEFEEKKKAGVLRHVGLTESMHFIAAALGWELDRTEDIITPILAEREITTPGLTVKPGHSLGVQQVGRGFCSGVEVITLFFRAAVGEKDPADTVEIKGTPDITAAIPGGVNGDIATCAITLNAVRSILKAAPGLKTMADIPVVSWH